jgi:hypothetical protein
LAIRLTITIGDFRLATAPGVREREAPIGDGSVVTNCQSSIVNSIVNHHSSFKSPIGNPNPQSPIGNP